MTKKLFQRLFCEDISKCDEGIACQTLDSLAPGILGPFAINPFEEGQQKIP
jgi:hypothetical protein